MCAKGKLTNKQAAAIGLDIMDNGQNRYEKDRRKMQKKNDNVRPQ